MKLAKQILSIFIVFISMISLANAGDFAWLNDFNIKAEADPSGVRVKVGTRFRVGDAEIKAVFSNVDHPADAYMVFRLGEMSGRSTDEVLRVYKSSKNKGWGVMAKNLGIKPGSPEFHALKQGHDLDKGKAVYVSADKGNPKQNHHEKKGNGKNK